MADVTKIANMINPEVMADVVRDKLTDLIKFTPLAKIDTTLQGRAGDTVTLPKFAYIGDAADVAEGEAIPMSLLTTSTSKVKVKKAGKGIKITDEAVLSGYGDPVGEGTNQLSLSIAAKVDNDCLTALSGIKANMTVDVSAKNTIGSHVIADGLVKFGEDLEGEKVLLIAPAQLAQIRKDPDYLKPSEMTQKAIMSGVIGEIWGCQICVSNKIKASGSKYTNYIVKPGALAIYLKRGVEVETARDISLKLTEITADEHYAVYLLDESKAVKLVTAENPVAAAA
ncbi:MAG: N4-gp56 family major capsid protein [Clostridium sp.]|nr:N4-gp56 family major capsid protein [Clostridium sp.]